MVQYWRQAGLSYLRYTNVAAEYLRKAMKEPMRSKALAGIDYSMVKGTWADGKIVQRETLESTGGN